MRYTKSFLNSWSCYIFRVQCTCSNAAFNLNVKKHNFTNLLQISRKKVQDNQVNVDVAMLHFACENNSKLWGVKLRCGHHLWNKLNVTSILSLLAFTSLHKKNTYNLPLWIDLPSWSWMYNMRTMSVTIHLIIHHSLLLNPII